MYSSLMRFKGKINKLRFSLQYKKLKFIKDSVAKIIKNIRIDIRCLLQEALFVDNQEKI